MASKIDKKLALIAADFLALKNQNRSLLFMLLLCMRGKHLYINVTKIEVGIFSQHHRLFLKVWFEKKNLFRLDTSQDWVGIKGPSIPPMLNRELRKQFKRKIFKSCDINKSGLVGPKIVNYQLDWYQFPFY